VLHFSLLALIDPLARINNLNEKNFGHSKNYGFSITSLIGLGMLSSGTTTLALASRSQSFTSFSCRKSEALPWQLLQVLFCGVMR
jgi:hypothetical protein